MASIWIGGKKGIWYLYLIFLSACEKVRFQSLGAQCTIMAETFSVVSDGSTK